MAPNLTAMALRLLVRPTGFDFQHRALSDVSKINGIPDYPSARLGSLAAKAAAAGKRPFVLGIPQRTIFGRGHKLYHDTASMHHAFLTAYLGTIQQFRASA
jgi:hypothetical protein